MFAPLMLSLAVAPWWSAEVDASLDRAPDRKAAWTRAITGVPGDLRASISYLLEHLPEGDLKGLPPKALLENARLAHEARSAVRWGTKLPREVFLDAVLPHASVTEPRRSMRATFMKRYLPLVRECATPGEAALKMNQTLFRDYKVTYNTKRLRTDQCSRETIAQGMATCTGLSIMLVEALRSVAVPARLAGIYCWPGREEGNHTWVEVWSEGRWHFVGAAEPDEKGLDHAWFAGEAAKAIRDQPRHAIYALTYRRTGERFPLAWDPGASAYAVNVTDRYRGDVEEAGPRLMIDVWSKGERVPAIVWLVDLQTGQRTDLGRSMGPADDMNRFVGMVVTSGSKWRITVEYEGRSVVREVTLERNQVVRIDMEQN